MTTEKYAIALGMFDGVHIGHKAVLEGAVKSPYRSVAVTFSSIPGKAEGALMTPREREEKLRSLGIDEVLFLNFFEVKDLSPTEFLGMLSEKYTIGKICCGFNYRFGKKASGDPDFLRNWCNENGVEFFECPEVVSKGRTVSSTYIKALIAEGNTEKAAELLGEPFSFTAEVVKGDQRGRTWGLPTINQLYPEGKARPKNGVYQTVVEIRGKRYDGVTNIGLRPTFITDYISSETFILDYSDDCYGETVKTELYAFLREEKKFSSVDELIAAIKQNAEQVKMSSKK